MRSEDDGGDGGASGLGELPFGEEAVDTGGNVEET